MLGRLQPQIKMANIAANAAREGFIFLCPTFEISHGGLAPLAVATG
jgi:hypothetical protein